MTQTAISAVVARRPVMLTGWVSGLAAHVRPWVRLDITLCDETGCITVRFLGRTHIPGLGDGCYLNVEGTPWQDGGSLVILNPLYASVSSDIDPVHQLRSVHPDEESGR